MNYQKVYMNQIHSSSLLCQLAQMWRSQLVCDAYIRTGTVTTKAHRVVLLAACPMLQSMEKASIGSHLEVRLTADIKQEAVNMFLQYLYEGFMLLTEENCKDVEKVARLLQVDSVIKCCADFYKCLESKTGNNMYSNSKYKYSSYDMLEFRHVRATDLQKTVQDRLMKRASEMGRPLSPSSKKQRLYRASTPPSESSQSSFSQRADDTFSMSHSYGSGQQEPWDRVPRPGANAASMSRGQSQRFQQPSVIDIVEDSIELIHVDPGDGSSHQPPSQKGVAVSVASQLDSGPPNISIVSVTGNTGPPHGPSPSQGHSQRQTSGPSYSSPHIPSSSSYTPRHSSVSSSPSQSKASDRAIISLTDPQISQITREVTHQIQQQEHSASSSRPPALQLAPGLTSPHESLSQQRPPHFPFTERLQQTASKPSFAAGSARQVGAPQMPNLHSGSSSTGSPSTLRPDRSPSLSGRSDSMDRPPSVEASKDSSKQKNEDSSTASSADLMADITIIKVETGDETMSKEHKDSGQPGHSSDGVIHSTDHSGLLSGDTTGGLDMHVDAPDDGGTMTMQIQRNDDGMGQEGDSDIEELEATGDWPHDSNDDSSLSNDPNNPLGGFRGILSLEEIQYSPKHDEHNEQSKSKQAGHSQAPDCDLNVVMTEISALHETGSKQIPSPLKVPKMERSLIQDDDVPRSILSPQHRLVHNQGGRALTCLYCKLTGCKTDKGYSVRSYYRCESCDAALCSSGSRNCYNLFHEFLKRTRNPNLQWTKFTY
ncbi:B-cell lymphoma 6 protein-like isoform X2 [Mytilus edulis]|uniref:B-cell lymphoma 6 protein-like isoform X2 n=1 Tax=Mytilus edulis TaxID=6550 RepID=UPI0039EE71CF